MNSYCYSIAEMHQETPVLLPTQPAGILSPFNMGQQQSRLIEAAREGKLAEINKMVPPHEVFRVNSSPYVHIALIAAAAAGREEVVTALLAAGAHPLFHTPQELQDVIGNWSGQTALSSAVSNGHDRCASHLFAAVSRRGETVTQIQQHA
jgi:hypothetical protein